MKTNRGVVLVLWVLAALQFMPFKQAAAFDESDEYLIFTSSVRDRSRGETRFTSVLTFVFGDPDSLKAVFGGRGPNPKQLLRLNRSGRAVRFRSSSGATVSGVQFRPNSGLSSPILSFRLQGARCRESSKAAFRSCSGTVQVFNGRSSIRGRLLFTSDDGLTIGNDSSDVSSSYVYAPRPCILSLTYTRSVPRR